jgi:uncharacterized membrane-anchored protein YitT (DUF2179 family)
MRGVQFLTRALGRAIALTTLLNVGLYAYTAWYFGWKHVVVLTWTELELAYEWTWIVGSWTIWGIWSSLCWTFWGIWWCISSACNGIWWSVSTCANALFATIIKL